MNLDKYTIPIFLFQPWHPSIGIAVTQTLLLLRLGVATRVEDFQVHLRVIGLAQAELERLTASLLLILIENAPLDTGADLGPVRQRLIALQKNFQIPFHLKKRDAWSVFFSAFLPSKEKTSATMYLLESFRSPDKGKDFLHVRRSVHFESSEEALKVIAFPVAECLRRKRNLLRLKETRKKRGKKVSPGWSGHVFLRLPLRWVVLRHQFALAPAAGSFSPHPATRNQCTPKKCGRWSTKSVSILQSSSYTLKPDAFL